MKDNEEKMLLQFANNLLALQEGETLVDYEMSEGINCKEFDAVIKGDSTERTIYGVLKPKRYLK